MGLLVALISLTLLALLIGGKKKSLSCGDNVDLSKNKKGGDSLGVVEE